MQLVEGCKSLNILHPPIRLRGLTSFDTMALSWKQRLALLLYLRKRRLGRHRSVSVHPINRLRSKCGEYHHLMTQLLRHDTQKFKEYFGMDPSTFDYLLQTCSPDLLRQTKKPSKTKNNTRSNEMSVPVCNKHAFNFIVARKP